MSGSHPLLQVHRVIKELRIALVLSHHDGNTALTDHRNLLHYFLFKTSDLGNTPFRCDPVHCFLSAAASLAWSRGDSVWVEMIFPVFASTRTSVMSRVPARAISNDHTR